MSKFRGIDRTVLAKVETTAGTDAAPVVGTDAVAVEEPTFEYGFETDETNEVTGSLDRSARYTGGGQGGMSFSAILKGASAGGSAPEVSPLLRGCALAETLLASDVSDTLQASSTATSLNLAAGEITADGLHVGAVIEITSGTYAGEKAIITGSTASTDVVTIWPALAGAPSTDDYTIHAHALYAPASSGLETVTLYQYLHNSISGENDRLEKLLGAAGTLQLNIPVRRVGRWRFNFSGQLTAPADVTKPADATYGSAAQPVLKSATCYIGDVIAKFAEFSIDFGNEVQLADDPTAALGYDVAGVTRRRIGGRINPRMELVATRNAFADIRDGTTRQMWLHYGTGDGGAISIYIPEARFVAATDTDNRGFTHQGLDFDCVGSDTGIYICIY
ncbi:unnamed protein product [Chrysoparadoxa australica]